MNYYFITGTSRGIGRSLALNILKEENNVVFGISRDCKIVHPDYHHFTIDLSIEKEMKDFRFADLNQPEKIVLINNSGTLGDIRKMGENDPEKILNCYKINAIAPAILMNAFIKQYRNTKAVKIIMNISSGAGRHPVKSWTSYCATKSALDMTSEVIFEEQKETDASNSFYVYSIAPGIVSTKMQDEIRGIPVEHFSEVGRFIEYHNQGMLTDPDDVAVQLISILNEPKKYKNVLLDVRDL